MNASLDSDNGTNGELTTAETSRAWPQSIEGRVKVSDGAELFYRHWPARKPAKVALLLFHRGHEHAARWQESVETLDLVDGEGFAWDARVT